MTKEAIVLGIFLGLLMAWKKKRFLSRPRFKKLIIAGTGAVLFIISLKMAPSVPFVARYFSVLHWLFLFVMAVGCLFGGHFGYILIGSGLLLNGLVVALNGYMPVEVSALLKTGDSSALTLISEGRAITHGLANEGTRLRFLCDRFAYSSAITSARVVSLGDGIIAIGLFLFVASAVTYLFGKVDRHEMDK
ncbi:MAG: DUF5317 family protein [Peptoniphilus sp.]|nr:DUF5317 family protein [Peptoniphilus sp.]MDY3119259.1 DUF5317 family protein [Peptoniphilus sp.]